MLSYVPISQCQSATCISANADVEPMYGCILNSEYIKHHNTEPRAGLFHMKWIEWTHCPIHKHSSCLCSQRIYFITAWTKTQKLWSVTLDCQRSREQTVSCPQPAVLLDTWVRHLCELSTFSWYPLFIHWAVRGSFILHWVHCKYFRSALYTFNMTYHISLCCREVKTTWIYSHCCSVSVISHCPLLCVLHSSWGSCSEAIQQSGGLLVHRSYFLYSVSRSSFSTVCEVWRSFLSFKFLPKSL